VALGNGEVERGGMASFVIKTTVSYSGAPRLSQTPGWVGERRECLAERFRCAAGRWHICIGKVLCVE